MRYVYLLRSLSHPDHHYVGTAANVRRRLKKHNSGDSPHTSKWRPWEVVAAIGFKDDDRALQFERYLKSGSGRAFAKRHLW